MGRRAKVSPEVKIRIVEEYLDGKFSISGSYLRANVSKTTFEEWVRKYRAFGPEGLKTKSKNTHYSTVLKEMAVADYFKGEYTMFQICKKYSILDRGILKRWIRKYNGDNKIKSHNNEGDRIMTNGRKTTYQERIEIVSFCIANANNYNLTSNKYKVSYQQVYTWVNKYNKNGSDALVDRRGKNTAFEELSETERISAQLKLLEAENKRLKMENDFLKKLEEIERR